MSAFTPSLPAVAGSTPVAVGNLPTAPGGDGTLAALANQLGMSADGLQSALKEGRSIAGLAEQQGVPREAVAQSVAAQIQQARSDSSQPPLDQEHSIGWSTGRSTAAGPRARMAAERRRPRRPAAWADTPATPA